MKIKTLRLLALLVGPLVMATTALGFKQGDFWSDRNHPFITADGITKARAVLPNFLSTRFAPDAIEEIEYWNQNTDRGYLDHGVMDSKEHLWDSEYHFDEDKFAESAKLIFDLRKHIIDKIKIGSAEDARKNLGLVLHTIQDFYAHSNWVEKRILNPIFPHPNWAESNPFKDPAFSEFGTPGDLSLAACSRDGLYNSAPLTTGYFDDSMLVVDWGAYTNEWRWFGPHLDWPTNHCVHGAGGSSSGLNKDDDKRLRFKEAKGAATEATADFVQRLLNDIVREIALSGTPVPFANNLCAFLKQEATVCAVQSGFEVVSAIEVGENSAFAGHWFTVSVKGSNLSKFLHVILTDGECQSPINGSANEFKVQCKTIFPGSSSIKIYDREATTVLRSRTIDIGAENQGVQTFFAKAGASVGLLLENLYSSVTTAVWRFASTFEKFVASVSAGASHVIDVVFNLPGEEPAKVDLKDGLGRNVETIDAKIQVVNILYVTPPTVTAGRDAVFEVGGESIPTGLTFHLSACGAVSELTDDTSSTRRRFACTVQPSAVAGLTTGTISSPGQPGSPFGILLFEFQANIVRPVVTSVSAEPLPKPSASSVVSVTGSHLPSTAVVLVIDANCDHSTAIAKPDGTGFTQWCTFGPEAGTKAVQVMSASDASGFVIDDSKTLTVGAVQPSSTVADTGVASCTDYAFSPFSLVHTVGLDCALGQDPQGDPVPPRQDGATGRDALAARGLLEKIGSGPGGFDFTKLDASGAALPTSATDWACVRDNHTKLVWENKASDGGLRDHRHRYTWYSTAADANGGYAGSLGSNTCGGTLGAACNTQAYVAALNAAQLCGGSGWRLPKLEELRSIANFGRVNPSIDVAWFSNTAFIPSVPSVPGSAVGFWSSNVYSANPTFGVMGMEFSYGLLMTPIKSSLLAARAVMSDK